MQVKEVNSKCWRLEVEVSLMNKIGGKARKDRWSNRSVERETEL